MRAVADEVGMKAASLYYHYKSKAELVTTILEEGVQSVSLAVNRAIATLPPSSTHLDRVRAAFHAHLSAVAMFEDYSIVSCGVCGQVPPEVQRKYNCERNIYGQVWYHLLEAARDAGEIRADLDIKLTCWFILGALNTVPEWHHPGTKPLDEMSDQLFELITDGLTRRDGSLVDPTVATGRRLRR